MKAITKDMWKGDPEGLVGVWVLVLWSGKEYKIEVVDKNAGNFLGWVVSDGKLGIEPLKYGNVEIITPEERPDLYPEYFNQKEILPVNKIDHDQYKCDFTKPMWLCVGHNEMVPVQPEDIVIVRKNQVCLIDTRTDQLRDAMVQDFTNTKPKMGFEDFVDVLTSKCDSHKSVAYFFRNSGLLNQDADFEAALEKFQWNK